MINLTLDNIIFSLQKSGGASVVWQQHLERVLKDDSFKCSVVEFRNAQLNFFRTKIQISPDLIRHRKSCFLFVKRYLNLNSREKEKHIFHSSHYRIEKGENIINVTTVHDFTYEYFVKGFRRKIHSWQKLKAINLSQGIICISESTKRDLIKFLPDLDHGKIRVIYNGVDEIFKPIMSDSTYFAKLPFEHFNYVVYVGDRASAYKNFNLAIDSCSLAKIPLLIIGGGILNKKERSRLESKLGVENFKSLINVSTEDLNFYYNKAICLLYLSLYEGFGIPVVEAQKAGCPVIAINSSSIPEVIGNPILALDNPDEVKIAKFIKELSINNEFRQECIELGFNKSKKFSWKNTYEDTVKFYKELYGQ